MSLGHIQFASLVTKGVTTALGLVQSGLVVWLLTVEEFGLVGLVMSIGGVIGVTQHLGVVDGAIREIAVRKKKVDIGKVFWVSHLVRQAVTIPLTLGLIVLAGFIATNVYQRPELVPYLQLFALSLILQGLQDVLGATLTGRKQFKPLYIIQAITALINVVVFGVLTALYDITGFFWAILATTSVMVLLLSWAVARDLRGNLALPNWSDIRRFGRSVMRIGAYMYIARILFVVWQKLPLLLLGPVLIDQQLGFLNAGLAFGSRLTIIAMALSEVNLSWMSTLFVKSRDEFRRVVTENLQRVLVALSGITLTILFFGPDVLQLLREEYVGARSIVLILTCAFFIYALIDIATSSVFVPADKPRLRATVYALMTLITATVIGWLLLGNPSATHAAWGVFTGAVGGYILALILSHRLSVNLVTRELLILGTTVVASLLWLLTEPFLVWRIPVFLVLAVVLLWQANTLGIIPGAKKKSQASKEPEGQAPTIAAFAGGFLDAPTWTNRQQILTRVARTYPVLYVEPRVLLWSYIAKNWRNPRRVTAWLKRIFLPAQFDKHIRVVAQVNLFPGSRKYPYIGSLNHWLFNRWRVALHAGPVSTVWIYDTEAAEYLSAFSAADVVYDCVDDHAAQAGANATLVKKEEDRILARANLVTVTSRQLLKDKRRVHPNVHLVEQAGDVNRFASQQKKKPESKAWRKLLDVKKLGPVVGSVGALDTYKYDFDLIRRVALTNPNIQFVFIGRPLISSKRASRIKLDNVHFLGALPQDEVPAYVQQFDVCAIPYRRNKYNESSVPLKFWEFMATGKPIIVSGLPELKEHTPLISYVKNVKEFSQALRMSLEAAKHGADERRRLSTKHSWEDRTAHILKLLEQL